MQFGAVCGYFEGGCGPTREQRGKVGAAGTQRVVAATKTIQNIVLRGAGASEQPAALRNACDGKSTGQSNRSSDQIIRHVLIFLVPGI